MRVDPALVSATQQEYQQLARFHFDRGQRLAEQQQDREAIGEFRKSLYLSPYDAQTHLALGRVLMRAGRLRDATESLKISLWSAESLEARLLLAEALLSAGESPPRSRTPSAPSNSPRSPQRRGRCSSASAPRRRRRPEPRAVHRSPRGGAPDFGRELAERRQCYTRPVQIAGAGANCACDLAVLMLRLQQTP